MNIEDILIESYTSYTGISMKLTHMPTGLHVGGEGKSYFLLRNKLTEQLRRLVEGGTPYHTT